MRVWCLYERACVVCAAVGPGGSVVTAGSVVTQVRGCSASVRVLASVYLRARARVGVCVCMCVRVCALVCVCTPACAFALALEKAVAVA